MNQQELLDRAELGDLVMRYSRGVDRRDYALVRSLYHDDAIDDHGEMFCGTPDEYLDWLPSALEPLECTIHSISNSLFVIDGDVAEGEHYGVAFHRTRAVPRQEIIIYGRYLDRYERRGGAWKFAHRKIVFDHGYVTPVDEMSLASANHGTPLGKDGAADLSYDFPLLAGLSK